MNWKLYSGIMLIQILTAFTMFSYIPMLVPIAEELNLNSQQIGTIALANALGGIVLGIFSGWLVDRIHTRYIILLGIGSMTIALYMFSQANSLLMILIASFIISTGYTIVIPLTSRLIAFYFEPKRMATLLSIKQSGSTVGQALGGFILPIIIIAYSWRTSLQMMTVLMLVLLLFSFIYFFSKDTSMKSKETIPSVSSKNRKFSFDNIKIPGETFFLLLLGFLMLGYQATVAAFLIPYLNDVKYLTYALAGVLLGVTQFVGAFSRPLFGWLSDVVFKGSRKKVLILCGIGNFVFTNLLVFFPINTFSFIIIILILLGITVFGWTGVYFSYIVEIVGNEKSGLATGYGLMANSIGAAVNPLLFGTIVFYYSYNVAFFINSVFVLLMMGLLQLKLKDNIIIQQNS